MVKNDMATLQADPAVSFKPKFNFVDDSVQLDAAHHAATVTDNHSAANDGQKITLRLTGTITSRCR